MNFLPPQQNGRKMHTPNAMYANGIDLVPAANIQPESITWLLNGWLASGKFHLLAGPPGTGKSTITTAIMASLSNGCTGGFGWPGDAIIPTGQVILWSCEDGIEDTIVPRLIAAGADLTRIHIIRGTKVNGHTLPFGPLDIPRLNQEIERIGIVSLIVIDPILLVVAGDSNKNAEVRRALSPLLEIGELHGCAILGITHINKSSKGKEPLDRVNGSVAYGAVARVVMMTARVECGNSSDGPGSSVIVRAKSNIGQTDGGYEYQIESSAFISNGKTINTSRIAWSPTSLTGSAKSILKYAEGGDSGDSSKVVEQAANFLKDILANGGRSFPEIEQLSQAAGISIGSIKRAKLTLGITSKKQTGMGQVSPYFWYLPEQSNQQMPQAGFMNQNAPLGHAHHADPFNIGQPYLQQNAFQSGMQFQQRDVLLTNLPYQPVMQMSAPLFEGVGYPQPPAPAAPPAPPAPPAFFAENQTVESEVNINPKLLAWMVAHCKQLLSKYHSDDPTTFDEDRYDDLQDRIVSIEFETVDSGLESLSEDEIDRSERPYRKALSDTKWWVS